MKQALQLLKKMATPMNAHTIIVVAWVLIASQVFLAALYETASWLSLSLIVSAGTIFALLPFIWSKAGTKLKIVSQSIFYGVFVWLLTAFARRNMRNLH